MPKEEYIPPEKQQQIIMMEYQKMINLSDSTTNQPSKFRTKHWVEISNDSQHR